MGSAVDLGANSSAQVVRQAAMSSTPQQLSAYPHPQSIVEVFFCLEFGEYRLSATVIYDSYGDGEAVVAFSRQAL